LGSSDAILLTTLLTFLLITLLSGHLLSLFLSTYIPSPRSQSTIADILLDAHDDPWDPYGEGGTIRIRYAPSSTAFEIIRGAIGVFAGGEAGEVMVQLWEMTVGALLGGRGEVGGLGSSTAASSSMEGRQHDEGLLSWLSQIIQSISNLLGISPFSPSVPLPPPPHPLSLSLPPLPTSSLVDWLLHRLTLGVALVGSASFVSFLLSFSLLPIFSVFNSYHIPAFARLGRSARGRGARGGGGMRGGSDGVGIGAIVMVIIVGTGLIRSVSIHPIRSSFLSLPLSLPPSLSLSLSLSLSPSSPFHAS
jgi:hypothetical protein